ncbi:unnamed protein product [Eruca vesicaria subsp. sativa]|uniref:BZIP domain-containing protein n=1 Tax=Eruca vesicaria subsp. sativa TaxID=29727 RepID=A0ABC8IPX9_ERUVS|nr:unnamed protein product [Eruca vesicaria subsp. sativa]
MEGVRSAHKKPTLGEMTLEDLLLKAVVVTETIPGGGLGQNITQAVPWVQYHQLPSIPYPVVDMQAMVSQSSLMGGLSDTQTPGKKRVGSGEVVERKQKKMIKKNRDQAIPCFFLVCNTECVDEQAYTHELEIKVSRLEEENERLRRQKEVEKILPSAPPPDPKQQLRRTSSAPF